MFSAGVLGIAVLAGFVTRSSWTGGSASAQAPQRARVISVELTKAERNAVPVDVDSIGTVTPISSVALQRAARISAGELREAVTQLDAAYRKMRREFTADLVAVA